MKRFFLLSLLSLFTLFFAACTSTPETGDQQAGAKVEERGAPDGKITTVDAPNSDSSTLNPILTDPKNILSRRSIYFDYDSYEIRAEYKDVVAAHAKFLNGNRNYRMLIQGNTDERGSREYNLALGQKRADAVRRAFSLLGVGEDQIESVSLGKEKPKNPGHDEAAWAENRRADILYRDSAQNKGEF
ncbi:MAG: peptidoglycan-associated lipoprotein Pal [Betaproteobacteria bacterium]|nr:peptidoglycan-associated lipoprotein Pal [Betaproteobacteria bacterium]